MRKLLILLLSLYILPLSAQLESWKGISFEHEVTPTFGYIFDLEYRSAFETLGRGEWLLLTGLNRKLTEQFDLATAVRFQNGGPEGESELRVLADLNFKQAIPGTPLKLTSRLRYQQDRIINAESGPELTTAIRPRISLIGEITESLSLFAEFEGRYRFDVRNEWSRLRYTAGFEVKLTDTWAVEPFYRIDDRINTANPRVDHIVGLYFQYTLPDKRERDWEYRSPFGRKLLN
jgi:hypothetical protein